MADMTKLEQAIRRSLSRVARATAHLSEDQLCAFAENALAREERSHALRHLAECSECREQLHLIAGEIAPPVTPELPASKWSTWVWGPALALATFSVVFLIPREVPERPREGIFPPQRSVETRPFVPPAPSKQTEAPREVKLPPPPPIARQARPLFRTPLLDSMRIPLTPQPPRVGRLLVRAEAAPLTKSGFVSEGAKAGFSFVVPVRTAGDPAGSSWRVSTETNLVERSSDQGRTWQPVPLDRSVRFLSVARAGRSIWAAGNDASQAVLFASADGGSHWRRVPGPAAGEITAINTVSELEVEFTVASGERWKTVDGGRNWIKVY